MNCEDIVTLQTETNDGMLAVRVIAAADRAESGTYSLVLNREVGGNITRTRQGGAFGATDATGDVQTLTRTSVNIDGSGSWDVILNVETESGCSYERRVSSDD